MKARRPALMGIDLGTTATKVGLFEATTGELLAVARHDYRARAPAPGWSEMEIETYWEATVAAARHALDDAERPEVLGIGISSQGQTFAPLDEGHRPLRPAIVWLDTRAEEQAAHLRSLLDDGEFSRRTGLPFPSAIESAAKLLWLRENEREVWHRIRSLVLLPDYLGLRLTGHRRLDLNNAASTGMVDLGAGDWWPEALAAVGVPAEWMSPIGRPGEVIGALRPEAAEELSLSPGIPVALGSNDQLSGAVGVGNVKAGMASGTVGTAMALVSTLEEVGRDAQRAITWGRHPVPGLFFLLAYAKTSGVLLTWLRDLAAAERSYEQLLAEADRVPPGSDGLVCLPHFSGTATPTFRSEVRGGFVGLTLAHSRAHMVRAVAEAVCFTCRDALSLTARGGQPAAAIRMLGGATRSDLWMQMLADVVRLPLEVPRCSEASVLGSAVFAGVGEGRFASISEGAGAFYRPGRSFTPRPDIASRYDPAYASYRKAMERLYPGALGATAAEEHLI